MLRKFPIAEDLFYSNSSDKSEQKPDLFAGIIIFIAPNNILGKSHTCWITIDRCVVHSHESAQCSFALCCWLKTWSFCCRDARHFLFDCLQHIKNCRRKYKYLGDSFGFAAHLQFVYLL